MRWLLWLRRRRLVLPLHHLAQRDATAVEEVCGLINQI